MKRQPREPPQRAKHKSKKDTVKWCKGVVGREHDCKAGGNKYYWVYACVKCGKHMDYWFTNSFFRREAEKIPKWLPLCVVTKEGLVERV